MGECACGQEEIEFTIPGPEGSRYGIEVYSGCHYCGNGASVQIYRIPDESLLGQDMLDSVERRDFIDYAEDVEVVTLPILTPEALVDSMKLNMGQHLSQPERLSATGLFRTVQDAVWLTQGGKLEDLRGGASMKHCATMGNRGTRKGESRWT